MKDQFDVQTELFGIFSTDSELLGLLEVTGGTEEELNNKIRRVMADTTVMTSDDVSTMPFFDFTFVPIRGHVNNYLVSKSTLEFNIYSPTWNSIEAIYKRLHTILQNTYEDAQVTYGGQGSSGITGVMRYVFRVHQLTKA